MEKIEVVHHTLEASHQVLTAIQQKTTPDTNSWDKWCEALFRDVLYHTEQRTFAQYLENIERATLTGILSEIRDNTKIIKNLEVFIKGVRYVKLHDEAKEPIEFEPSFDQTWYPMPWGT